MPTAEKLKALRTTLNLSMRRMAKEIGIPYSSYNNYERGLMKPEGENKKKIEEFINEPFQEEEMETMMPPEFSPPAEYNPQDEEKPVRGISNRKVIIITIIALLTGAILALIKNQLYE